MRILSNQILLLLDILTDRIKIYSDDLKDI